MQPLQSEVGSNLIDLEVKQLWMFKEEDGSKVTPWCQGLVVAIKIRGRMHIQWNEDCLCQGDISISEEVLMMSKFNKHVERGWRMSLD